MEENKVDKSYQGISSGEEKKINQKIGKKVQNIRHYRFKMRPII